MAIHCALQHRTAFRKTLWKARASAWVRPLPEWSQKKASLWCSTLTNLLARRHQEQRAQNKIVSSVIVPIQVSGEVRGILSAAKNRGGTCFTEDDMSALSTFANQASLAIEKMDILDDLRNQVETLANTVGELRQTRAELLQSEKLASIGQLASGVAHEINNPLQVILGRTELLIDRIDDLPCQRDLDAIRESTLRIAEIVSNLLSFSRQSSTPEFRDLDLNAVLDKTLDLINPQLAPDDITVITDGSRSILPVHGNAGQLQQVFTNLILNAYHAMRPQGGGTLTISSRAQDGCAVVELTDTGPGIPQEHLGHIFEPFYTTKPEGTGLGLAIAYSIIRSHRGSIKVTSKTGSGARFTVSLPEAVSPSKQMEDPG